MPVQLAHLLFRSARTVTNLKKYQIIIDVMLTKQTANLIFMPYFINCMSAD